MLVYDIHLPSGTVMPCWSLVQSPQMTAIVLLVNLSMVIQSMDHGLPHSKTDDGEALKTDGWLSLQGGGSPQSHEDSGGHQPCIVGGVARATCFGPFNATDSTEMLQAALSSNASTVIIDASPTGGPWLVRPLRVTSSNQLLVFEAGVHIMAKRDEFHGLYDTLLTVNSIHNLTVEGNGAVLQMRRDDYAVPSRGTCPSCAPYTKAEWRSGIELYNASSIRSVSCGTNQP